MKGISCVVTPCSAAVAHTHRAVSNEVVLKLEASASTWCSAPNNQPYWNHLPLQDVHTRKRFSERVGELTGFKPPAMKWVSHKQQGQGRINEKKKKNPVFLYSLLGIISFHSKIRFNLLHRIFSNNTNVWVVLGFFFALISLILE